MSRCSNRIEIEKAQKRYNVLLSHLRLPKIGKRRQFFAFEVGDNAIVYFGI